MAAAGQAAGVETAAPVIEPQCPAVSTTVGEMSVPVHRNALPRMTSAIDGNSPAEALLPPTTALEGAAVRTRDAAAAAAARESLRRMVMEGPTRAGAIPCDRAPLRHHRRMRRPTLALLAVALLVLAVGCGGGTGP